MGDDRTPRRRERLSAQALSPAPFQESQDHVESAVIITSGRVNAKDFTA